VNDVASKKQSDVESPETISACKSLPATGDRALLVLHVVLYHTSMIPRRIFESFEKSSSQTPPFTFIRTLEPLLSSYIGKK
jgi:hypothetical protein